MIIYNVTIKVDSEIAEDWLEWMINTHIPEVLGTGCFIKHTLVRIMETDESEGPTFAVQYFAETIEQYHYYLSQYAPALRNEVIKKWGEQISIFRTVMEVLN